MYYYCLLYTSHTVDELHQIILIDGHLFKVLPVQVGPLAHEQLYPTHIGCAEPVSYTHLNRKAGWVDENLNNVLKRKPKEEPVRAQYAFYEYLKGKNK